MRSSLFAAVALAPLCLVAASAPAWADTTIDAAHNTPVATSTATGTGPDNVIITENGSIAFTAASAPAVTIDSSNTLTNDGLLQFNNVDNSTTVLLKGGNTGSLINIGTINNIEDYTAVDTNADALVEEPYAQGTGRYGVRLIGTSPFIGNIVNSGSIFTEGNNSVALAIDGPLQGSITNAGTIGVTGDNSFGIRTTAPVSSDIIINASVGTSGQGSSAIALGGDLGGGLKIYSTVSSNGYSIATRPTDDTQLKTIQSTPTETEQAGSALVVGGNVANGIFIAAPPLGTISTTTADNDADGVEDGVETTGTVSVYGSSPAILVGGTGRTVTIGPFGTGTNAYGMVIRGSVTADGIFDGVPSTGIQIGGTGSTATLTGGFRLVGTVGTSAYEASSTALLIGAGGVVPEFRNEQSLAATVLHSDLSTGATATATAIMIQPGGTLSTITNFGNITAAGTGPQISVAGVVDKSGTLTTINNEGEIGVALSAATSGDTTVNGSRIALDLRANTTGVTINQTVNAAPIPLTGATDSSGNLTVTTTTATSPSIIGDILLGSGPNTVNLLGGVDEGALDLGSGAANLTLDNGAAYTGALSHTGAALNINVNNGSLTDTNALVLQGHSLTVGAAGVLSFAVDPANSRATSFHLNGPATFATGAKLGINLVSNLTTPQTYVLVSSPSLSIGSLATLSADTPYVTVASLAADQTAGTLSVSLRRRTAAEAGLNAAETSALNAVYAALPNDTAVQGAVFSQYDRASFVGVYDQMLPDYSGGVFRLAAAASRAVSHAAADGGTGGGWVQEITVGARLSPGSGALPFHAVGFGIAGGTERQSAIGELGVTAAVFSGDVSNPTLPGNNRATASDYEVGASWRTDIGGLRLSARAAGGFVRYNYRRELIAFDTTGLLSVDRVASARPSGWSGSGQAGASYLFTTSGRLFLEPGVYVDYFRMIQNAYTEIGGGNAMDLAVAQRTGSETSATFSIRTGGSFGDEFRWRPEFEFGYREIVSGDPGSTTAHFATGGDSFTLAPAVIQKGGGFAQIGLSAGSDYYEFSVSTGAEMRKGYAEGDFHIRARLLF